jgi:hypothetical protein
MKYYLIDTAHEVLDTDGSLLGYRICDISEDRFAVADHLRWVEAVRICDIYTGLWYMTPDGVIGEFVFPVKPKPRLPVVMP